MLDKWIDAKYDKYVGHRDYCGAWSFPGAGIIWESMSIPDRHDRSSDGSCRRQCICFHR